MKQPIRQSEKHSKPHQPAICPTLAPDGGFKTQGHTMMEKVVIETYGQTSRPRRSFVRRTETGYRLVPSQDEASVFSSLESASTWITNQLDIYNDRTRFVAWPIR